MKSAWTVSVCSNDETERTELMSLPEDQMVLPDHLILVNYIGPAASVLNYDSRNNLSLVSVSTVNSFRVNFRQSSCLVDSFLTAVTAFQF